MFSLRMELVPLRGSLRHIDPFCAMTKTPIAWITTIAVFVTSCYVGGKTNKPTIPKSIVLQGSVMSENGGVPSCRMSCLSATGLLKHGEPDARTGRYRLSLTMDEASILDKFRFITDNGDTSFVSFNKELLRDSIIDLDFRLATKRRNYVVVTSSSVHQPHADVIDTIWLDLNGKRVPRYVSDSLWKDIPHK